ncbi:hypothetical protein [Nocardia sp. SC052]|uniref:hypothetical protein n=1 Tax=Nocardia sichangensis TaxID=3385975 RepID=UPI0039A25A42
MTDLVNRITAGDVIWIRRYVQRAENFDASHLESGNFEAGIAPVMSRDPKAGNAPVLDLRAKVDLENAAVEASFEVMVRFVFGGEAEAPGDEETMQFLREYGLDYAFGFVRAALVDDFRAFGFPPAIMPVDALDAAKLSELSIARPKAEPTSR